VRFELGHDSRIVGRRGVKEWLDGWAVAVAVGPNSSNRPHRRVAYADALALGPMPNAERPGLGPVPGSHCPVRTLW
jgi:hypothetical protein